MKTITVVNNKGGVGKSAVTFELASALTREGKRVLCIDLDEQSTISIQALPNNEGESTIFDVLTGENNIQSSIIKTKNFDILKGDDRTRALDKALPNMDDMFKLADELEKVSNNYDYCLIDNPAHLGACAYLALFASRSGGVLIPVEPDVSTIKGAVNVYEFIEKNKRIYSDLKILGLVRIKFRNYNFHKATNELIIDISNKINCKVFNTNIRECTALRESRGEKESIFDYKPKSNAAIDFHELALEIINK